jgi:hypothetical protein
VLIDLLPRNGNLLTHLLHSNSCTHCLFGGLYLATGFKPQYYHQALLYDIINIFKNCKLNK